MRAAVNLLAPGLYADRLAMLAHLSDHLERLWLLVDAIPPELRAVVDAHPRLVPIELGPRRFARRACDWVHQQLAVDALDVVHDTFGHLAEVFEAHGPDPRRRVRLVTTLYTSNEAWFARVRHRGMDLGRRYVAQRIISLWRDVRLVPHADVVVALGPGHGPDLRRLGAQRVEWLPGEIDVERFTPAPTPAMAGGPRLLFTGTVWRNKGVDLLLEVAETLSARWPDLRLSLVGNVVPWERAWLNHAVRRSPLGSRLEVVGRVPRADLLDRYRRADLFVFPSLFEGSPRSVREALSCGLRVVASDIPGCRGLDPRGDFIRFAPPDDRAAWSAAIDGLLSESAGDAAARSAAGVDHVRTHHAPAAVARRYAALYRQICRADRGARTRNDGRSAGG